MMGAMPTNTRHSHGTAFSKSIAPGGSAVYRVDPDEEAATTTLPENGATATDDVWQEVYHDGANEPAFILLVADDQTVITTIAPKVGD